MTYIFEERRTATLKTYIIENDQHLAIETFMIGDHVCKETWRAEQITIFEEGE